MCTISPKATNDKSPPTTNAVRGLMPGRQLHQEMGSLSNLLAS